MDTQPYYQKYTVVRNDGQTIEPDAEWFVLMVHKDPHARVALAAYADSVAHTAPELAASLRALIGKYEAN